MCEPSQSLEQSEWWRHPLGIAVSILSCTISAWPVQVLEEIHFSWILYLECCDLCGDHHTMLRHMQVFAFPHDHGSCLAFSAANTCSTQQADTWSSSFSGLLSVSSPSRRSRTVSQETGGSPQNLGQRDYLWCPLRRVPRKPTAQQGYRDSVPLLPVLSPSCC